MSWLKVCAGYLFGIVELLHDAHAVLRMVLPGGARRRRMLVSRTRDAIVYTYGVDLQYEKEMLV